MLLPCFADDEAPLLLMLRHYMMLITPHFSSDFRLFSLIIAFRCLLRYYHFRRLLLIFIDAEIFCF